MFNTSLESAFGELQIEATVNPRTSELGVPLKHEVTQRLKFPIKVDKNTKDLLELMTKEESTYNFSTRYILSYF